MSTKAPARPPPMRLKELSFYTCQHFEYKDHFRNEHKCLDYEKELLHPYLLPKVEEKRKAIVEFVSERIKDIQKIKKDVRETVRANKKFILDTTRHPDNLQIRQGALAASSILGFIAGIRLSRFKDSLVKGIVVSALATAAVGALCFPKESDVYFREVCYYSAKVGYRIYNISAGDNNIYRERVSCVVLPEKPKPSPRNKCPARK